MRLWGLPGRVVDIAANHHAESPLLVPLDPDSAVRIANIMAHGAAVPAGIESAPARADLLTPHAAARHARPRSTRDHRRRRGQPRRHRPRRRPYAVTRTTAEIARNTDPAVSVSLRSPAPARAPARETVPSQYGSPRAGAASIRMCTADRALPRGCDRSAHRPGTRVSVTTVGAAMRCDACCGCGPARALAVRAVEGRRLPGGRRGRHDVSRG